MHPEIKRAVEEFEFGMTAAEHKRAKARKKFQRFVDEEMDVESQGHESIYLDM